MAQQGVRHLAQLDILDALRLKASEQHLEQGKLNSALDLGVNGMHVQVIAAQLGEEQVIDGIPVQAIATEYLIQGGKRGGDLQRLIDLPLTRGYEGEAATRIATIEEALAVLNGEAERIHLPAGSRGARGGALQHPLVCRDGLLELPSDGSLSHAIQSVLPQDMIIPVDPELMALAHHLLQPLRRHLTDDGRGKKCAT